MTVYVMPDFKQYEKQLANLCKHKKSVSCLYINHLSDINLDVLEEIVTGSIRWMKEIYPKYQLEPAD